MAASLVRTRKKRFHASPTMLQHRAKSIEKQKQALELRKSGATYDEIARTLEYSDASAASKAVQSAIRNQVWDEAKDVLLLDLQRLDDMQKRVTLALKNGDISQVDRLMRIMEFRYRLTGVSSETAKELADQFGVDVQATDVAKQGAGVMVINQTVQNEEDFIKNMMQAANVDPDSKEAKEYLSRFKESKKGKKKTSKKKKKPKKIVVKKKVEATQIHELPPGINEEDIVEAEIVE